MSVIPLPRRLHRLSNPLIAFVDLQMEYVANGRGFALKETERCLGNCEKLLTAARSRGLPIAHFRQINTSMFFNRQSNLSQWIDRFRPRSHEMVFERELPSCYSNPSFKSFVEQVANPVIVIAGLTGEQSCLATIVDAAHRKHQVIFAHDASATNALGARTEGESHEVITELLGLYASVMSTDDVIDRLEDGQPLHWRSQG